MSSDNTPESGNGAGNGNGNGNGNNKMNGKNNGHGSVPSAAEFLVDSNIEQVTIALKGPLDKGLEEVEKALKKNVTVSLDFSDCHFISVDGLEWLEELLLRADSVGCTVRLVKIHPVQYKVFKVAHIQSLLKACGSPASGMAPMC